MHREFSNAAIRCAGRAIVAAVFLLSAGTFSAMAAPDPASCYGASGGKTTRIATYNGPDGTALQWGGDLKKGCPETAIRCARPDVKLRHGQALLIDQRYRSYVCTTAANKRGDSINGWLDAALVTDIRDRDPHPPLSAWVGTYGSPDEMIRIRAVKGKLQIDGTAYWPGKYYKPEPGMPDRQDGQFSFVGVPTGNHIALGDHSDNMECWVDLDLVGPFLVSGSGHGCGGLNVVFWGVLQRRPR